MKTFELRDKPLFQATLGDLIEALNEGFANEGKDGRANTNPSSEKRYVYGLFGISKLFGCSQATAQRIKSSGVIDAAISQNGKIIVVVLNEQVGQIGEIGVAPMVTVSLVNVQQDSLINKSEMVNEVQLWLNMLKYENKM